MALRRPADYQPKDGARFELHFEKARGLYGEAAQPIEAKLETDKAEDLKAKLKDVNDALAAGNLRTAEAAYKIAAGIAPNHPDVVKALADGDTAPPGARGSAPSRVK